MTENIALKPTIQDVLELLNQLRYSAVEFQQQIDIYFADAEGWQNIKTRFALFEERFVSLETRLATAHPEPDWQDEELNYMLDELREVREDFAGMRQEFLRALQESPQRIM
ncbi:MAG TPA: hypothetical protein VJZ26_04805 [Blastocatellia bacterium]|nr:hypothetical protein [Blastocatellia bacterium]